MTRVLLVAACLCFGTVSADDRQPAPPSAERITELVKALEVPIRMRSDNADGPADGSSLKYRYHWHTDEILELKRAGEAAVPALLALLEDKKKAPQTRAEAGSALMYRLVGTKLKHDPKIIAALNAAMKENEPSLRYGLVCSLAPHGLGVNCSDWESFKKNAEKAKREGHRRSEYDAQWMVETLGPPEERSFTPEVMDALLPQVIAALADEHPEVVAEAALTINCFGRPKQGATELLSALKRHNGETRIALGWALTQVTKDDPDVLKAILELLKSERDQFNFSHVVRMTGGFGPAAKDAVPILIDILKDDYWAKKNAGSITVYEEAIGALGRIGAAAKPAGPAVFARIETTMAAATAEAYDILDQLDPALGKEARARAKRRQEEFKREFEERNQPVPPVVRPIFPPRPLPPAGPHG
jgi:HEAT repeat protein